MEEMITIEESEKLVSEYLSLKSKASSSFQDKIAFKKHQDLFINKMSYLVTSKMSKYSSFSNFEDIKQEAFMALVHATTTYNPSKGMFFWWAHKYIDTKISRIANKHSTIKYPMGYAKNNPPIKKDFADLSKNDILRTIHPNNIITPHSITEEKEATAKLRSTFEELSKMQKKVINLAFGLSKRPLNVDKISRKLNIPEDHVCTLFATAMSKLRSKLL